MKLAAINLKKGLSKYVLIFFMGWLYAGSSVVYGTVDTHESIEKAKICAIELFCQKPTKSWQGYCQEMASLLQASPISTDADIKDFVAFLNTVKGNKNLRWIQVKMRFYQKTLERIGQRFFTNTTLKFDEDKALANIACALAIK